MLALGQLNLHQYAAPALLPLPCMMSPAFLRILEAIEGVIGLDGALLGLLPIRTLPAAFTSLDVMLNSMRSTCAAVSVL